MSTHITKKDISITVGVLLFAFIGIPLLLWLVSTVRLQNLQKNIEPAVWQVLELHQTAAQAAASSTLDLADLWQTAAKSTQMSWRETNYSGGFSVPTPYASAIQAIRQACTETDYDLKKIAHVGQDYYDGCALIVKQGDKYFRVSSSSFQEVTDESTKEILTRFFATAATAHMWEMHRENRTFRAFELLQQNPPVVWDLRFSSIIDRSN